MKAKTYPEMYGLEDTHFWFIGKRFFVQAALKRVKRPLPQILDVGCGTGGMTKFLTKWGKVIGVEQNTIAAPFAKKRGIRVIKASANHLPFDKQSFDLVTICDVLYHKGVKETEALNEAHRVLKPNGMLLITDCALPWLWSNHDIVMDAKYRYTKKQIRKLVTNAGFEVDELQYIYASIFPMFILSRLIQERASFATRLPRLPNIFNQLLTTVLFYESLLFPRLNPPFGSSILLVAHKV